MRRLVLMGLALPLAACSRPNPVFDSGSDVGADSVGGATSSGGLITTGIATTGAATATATGASATMDAGDTELDGDSGPSNDVGGPLACIPDSSGRRFNLRMFSYPDGACAGPVLAQSLVDLEPVQGASDEFVGRLCPAGCESSCPTVAQGAQQVRLVVPVEMLDHFPPATCVDLIAGVGPGDGCRVEYFAAWEGPADPQTGRGPVDYVGVNQRGDDAEQLPAPVPAHEFVGGDLCGDPCPQPGLVVGEWALQFPPGGLLLHDTQDDVKLVSNDNLADYHAWNLQSFVDEGCQPHHAWYGQRFVR